MNEQNRRSGETTRAIDKAIQDLFTRGSIVIFRDECRENTHVFLKKRIIARMRLEHPHVAETITTKVSGVHETISIADQWKKKQQ